MPAARGAGNAQASRSVQPNHKLWSFTAWAQSATQLAIGNRLPKKMMSAEEVSRQRSKIDVGGKIFDG
jgi:hypothetical protein